MISVDKNEVVKDKITLTYTDCLTVAYIQHLCTSNGTGLSVMCNICHHSTARDVGRLVYVHLVHNPRSGLY